MDGASEIRPLAFEAVERLDEVLLDLIFAIVEGEAEGNLHVNTGGCLVPSRERNCLLLLLGLVVALFVSRFQDGSHFDVSWYCRVGMPREYGDVYTGLELSLFGSAVLACLLLSRGGLVEKEEVVAVGMASRLSTRLLTVNLSNLG